jgi:hypothetical protein
MEEAKRFYDLRMDAQKWSKEAAKIRDLAKRPASKPIDECDAAVVKLWIHTAAYQCRSLQHKPPGAWRRLIHFEIWRYDIVIVVEQEQRRLTSGPSQ